MRSVLITGSNRGLGLEWVRQLAAENWRIYATCRHPVEARDLQTLAAGHKNISLHRLDVTKVDEIHAMALELLEQPLDMLLNNAGTYLEKYADLELQHIVYDDWRYTMEVNTFGPVRMAEAFAPQLARGERPLVATVSTHMGSIADIESPGSYYYRSSKAALNAAMKGLSVELKPRGIGVLLLHPGWVRTRMGGSGTELLAPESVRGMRALVEAFRMEDSGRFMRYDGVEMPW